ncbi:MAG: hypothetical protein KF716_15440 [Anaerolineae bacterium]|nr:hypothetical protein [Anaerolineae bacterium]
MVTYTLPVQSTAFVGRAKELTEISARLADPACRLLTLTGPGGIGKTRLALEAARMVMTNHNGNGQHPFPNGTYFISLQALNAPEQLVVSIGEAVGFQFYPGAELTQQLHDFLQNKTLLLLLDNLEHLLDSANIISDILTTTERIKMLATSREALNLQQEWLYPLDGMTVPAESGLDSVEDSSAVQLFIQNARRVQPGFSVERERDAIARICRLVGGMPLGIELAAGWVRALSCSEIADEISRSLDILETPTRNMPERHRNMRAVLDQSWLMLDADEQRMMGWLSIFQGGFTRESALTVAGASVRHLSALVDKSWVRRDSVTGRYDLHELLRQYAAERLHHLGEEDAARDAHARYFAAFMEQHERDIKFRRQSEALLEIEFDFANVRAAWRWAAERQNHAVINRMVEALNWFCDLRVRYLEGEEMLRTAAERFASFTDPDRRLTYNRLRARRTRLIMLGPLDYLHDLESLAEEMLAITEINHQCGDRAEEAFSTYLYAMAYTNLKGRHLNFSHALRYFEQSYAIYEELNDKFYMAELCIWIAFGQDSVEKSMDKLCQALELEQQTGDENGMGYALMHLAGYAFEAHEFTEAETYFEEAVTSQRRRGDYKGLHLGLKWGTEWKWRLGEFDKARHYAEELVRTAAIFNTPPYNKTAWASLGLVLILSEADYAEGKRLCRAALDVSLLLSFTISDSNLDAVWGLAVAARYENDDEALRHYFQEVINFDDYWDDSHRLSTIATIGVLVLDAEGKFVQAVELSAHLSTAFLEPGKAVLLGLEKWPLLQRLREKWRHLLGAAEYEAAWERGKTLDFEATVNAFLLPAAMVRSELATQALSPTAPSPADALTERELEVLRLVAEGRSNREIARDLVLALGTVKWYISEIYSKLSVNSRTQAIVRARELKLLS